jgi:hypothetical protein
MPPVVRPPWVNRERVEPTAGPARGITTGHCVELRGRSIQLTEFDAEHGSLHRITSSNHNKWHSWHRSARLFPMQVSKTSRRRPITARHAVGRWSNWLLSHRSRSMRRSQSFAVTSARVLSRKIDKVASVRGRLLAPNAAADARLTAIPRWIERPHAASPNGRSFDRTKKSLIP